MLLYTMIDNKVLIIIEGPTGVGKTDIAIELALRFGTEIISADSRQLYKELFIGTAKPSTQQLSLVKHHFINHISVFDYYNAFIFEHEVQGVLNHYFEKNDICIMVGGSGMYIHAVCNGIDLIPDINEEIRNSVNNLYKEKGIIHLQEEVKKIDKTFFEETDTNNPARLIRALEIFLQTGKPYSFFRKKTKLYHNVNKNKNRIDRRALQMIDEGLEQEEMKWYEFKNINALQTVGYKELFRYFDGIISKDRAIAEIQQNTRRYAKKQITWFKKDDSTNWLNAEDIENIYKLINQQHISTV